MSKKPRFIGPTGAFGMGMKSPYDKTTGSEPVTPKTASGDYYGTGVRNPQARIVKGSDREKISDKGLKVPPRSLA